jgi:hypothetical protein
MYRWFRHSPACEIDLSWRTLADAHVAGGNGWADGAGEAFLQCHVAPLRGQGLVPLTYPFGTHFVVRGQVLYLFAMSSSMMIILFMAPVEANTSTYLVPTLL